MEEKIKMDNLPEFVEAFSKKFKGYFRNKTLSDMMARLVWEFGNEQYVIGREKERTRAL